jgi:hypothetical protein
VKNLKHYAREAGIGKFKLQRIRHTFARMVAERTGSLSETQEALGHRHATRPILPYAGAGCLSCHELIPAARLQEEALSENERRAQSYVESEDVAEPSVITLNVLSAAQRVNDMLMMFTGLYYEGVKLQLQINFVRERLLTEVGPVADEFCLDCSDTVRSRRGRGDRVRLPCRARDYSGYNRRCIHQKDIALTKANQVLHDIGDGRFSPACFPCLDFHSFP